MLGQADKIDEPEVLEGDTREKEELNFSKLLVEYKIKVDNFKFHPRSTWSDEQKKIFCKRLRLQFCLKKNEKGFHMLTKEVNLNPKYFETTFAIQERNWTITEKELLYKGIETYGIGNFSLISRHLLPEWVILYVNFS
jgi:hypothetical protein